MNDIEVFVQNIGRELTAEQKTGSENLSTSNNVAPTLNNVGSTPNNAATSNILSRLIRKPKSFVTEGEISTSETNKMALFPEPLESISLEQIVSAATNIGSKVAAAEWWLGGNLSPEILAQSFVDGLEAACNGTPLPTPDGQKPVAMCALAGGHLLGRYSKKHNLEITTRVKQQMICNFREGLRRKQSSSRRSNFGGQEG